MSLRIATVGSLDHPLGFARFCQAYPLLFFITLKPRVERYKSLCALNTSPPRNRLTFTLMGYLRNLFDFRCVVLSLTMSFRTDTPTNPPKLTILYEMCFNLKDFWK